MYMPTNNNWEISGPKTYNIAIKCFDKLLMKYGYVLENKKINNNLEHQQYDDFVINNSDNKIKSIITIKEFMEVSNLAHNNKYNYSKTNYVNAITPVIVICPEIDSTTGEAHGEFIVKRPLLHMRGNNRCPKCKITKNMGRTKLTTEHVINSLKKIYGDNLIYDKVAYTKATNKIIVTCPKHGDIETIYHNFSGCKYCKREKNNNAKLEN